MSKKIMKRSLALGALMAFVITGSAMAAEVSVAGSTIQIKDNTIGGNVVTANDNVIIETTNTGYYGVYGYSGEVNVGDLTINSQSGGINLQVQTGAATTDLTINANDVTINNADYSAVYNGDAKSGSKITLNVSGKLAVDGVQLSVTGVDKNLIVNAKEIDADLIATGIVSYGNVTLKADDINIATTADTAISNNKDVTLMATNTLEVSGDLVNKGTGRTELSGMTTTVNGDVLSKGYAGTTYIGADEGTTIINGAVKITNDAGGGDTINVGGKNIYIDSGDASNTVAVYGGYAGFDKETTVNLGTSDTELINLKGSDLVLRSQYEHSDINVYGKQLNVEVTGGADAYGLYTGNNSECYTPSSEINIYADNTKIDMVNGGCAIVAFSQSTINVHGGIEANGDAVILVRGNSTVGINTTGEGVVKLDGDIVFHSQGTDKFIAANNTVNVNLTTEDSYLNGSIRVENSTTSNQTKEDVTGMTLGLSNGATWNVTGESFVNTLNGTDGIITVEETTEGLVTVDEDNTSNLTVATTTEDGDTNATLTALSKVVVTEDADGNEISVADQVQLKNAIYDNVTATVNGLGDVTVDEGSKQVASANVSVNEMAAIGLMSWRAEMNDMNKRMGELRNANGEHGVWVRMVRGESEYGSVKNQYNQYQLGYDEKLSVDKRWTVGVALSYTDAENSFAQGNGESTNKALSIYGSKLNNDGTFVDLIAKYARLENDYTAYSGQGNGEYDTNGYSFSAEVGKRIQQGKGLWIEPQVELTYGKVSAVDYVTENGVNVAQDGMESLVGRVGFSLGKDIKQGNVYARASYLYDFDGETKATLNNDAVLENDLGGGWWEVGVGANINLSKATYIYADVEKTFGGEVDTNWQWNLGVRYSF